MPQRKMTAGRTEQEKEIEKFCSNGTQLFQRTNNADNFPFTDKSGTIQEEADRFRSK